MVARFQFIQGAAPQHTAVERWPAEWLAAVPEGLGWSFSREAPGRGTVATAWRLVGANNRELGRSARTYADLAACRAAVSFLREHINEGDTLLANGTDTGLWIWRLNIGQQWMAVAGRSYLRRRECLYNLAQFVAEAPIATLPSGTYGRSELHDRPEPRGLADLPKIDMSPSPNQAM